jgi:ribonuclease HII
MASWIGPVIIAAAIAGAINVVGWFVTFRNSRRLEQAKREEKIIDVQTALLAEIRSDYASLEHIDVSAIMVSLEEKFSKTENGYLPLIPRDAGNPIFQSVVSDVSILPTNVIDPVVVYYKQQEAIAHFAEDLRGKRFEDLASDRKMEMIAIISIAKTMRDRLPKTRYMHWKAHSGCRQPSIYRLRPNRLENRLRRHRGLRMALNRHSHSPTR